VEAEANAGNFKLLQNHFIDFIYCPVLKLR